MNISINIQAPELAQAILTLASALGQQPKLQPNPSMVKEMNTVAQPQAEVFNQAPPQQVATFNQAPPVQNVPVAPPIQQAPVTRVQNVVPMTPPVQQPQAVPTSAPAYTMDQLAVAATQLVDAGRRNEVSSLIATFGCQSLMQLPQELYGTFATKLRELGANI